MKTTRHTLQTSGTLLDVETLLSDVADGEPEQPRILHLPRHVGPLFFKEARVSSILASAMAHCSCLAIRDYEAEWPSDELPDHFGETLTGVTSIFYIDSLQSARGVPAPRTLARRHFLRIIGDRRGILESTSRDKSITICCFDPTNAEPLTLRGLMYKPSLFGEVIMELRTELEWGTIPRTPADVLVGSNKDFMRFVFELYQNGFEHGRHDEQNNVIRGLRFIQMKRHVGTKAVLMDRARGFAELADYIAATVVPNSGENRFYEINISDVGLGILDGFRSKTSGYLPSAGETAAIPPP